MSTSYRATAAYVDLSLPGPAATDWFRSRTDWPRGVSEGETLKTRGSGMSLPPPPLLICEQTALLAIGVTVSSSATCAPNRALADSARRAFDPPSEWGSRRSTNHDSAGSGHDSTTTRSRILPLPSSGLCTHGAIPATLYIGWASYAPQIRGSPTGRWTSSEAPRTRRTPCVVSMLASTYTGFLLR